MKDILIKLMFNIFKTYTTFTMVYPVKSDQFVANLHDKEEYVPHIKDLKQALNHGLVLKKVNRS